MSLTQLAGFFEKRDRLCLFNRVLVGSAGFISVSSYNHEVKPNE